jgi:GNAT superfamily N-acetyltransferase
MEYDLRTPTTGSEWTAYHDIRRRVLFELRGQATAYDPEHPDELASGHYPLVLYSDDRPVAAIRIDVDEDTAIFRRVAVREDAQRRGHGRRLLAAAERFARDRGCRRVLSHVDAGAVAFYKNCGFRFADEPDPHAKAVLMMKWLVEP